MTLRSVKTFRLNRINPTLFKKGGDVDFQSAFDIVSFFLVNREHLPDVFLTFCPINSTNLGQGLITYSQITDI